MKNGEVRVEAKQLEDKIYLEINNTLRKKRGLKKALADHLEYAAQNSLSTALKERSFKLGRLFDIMYFLDLEPMHVFTDETRLNIEKLTLYDLVRKICGAMLEEHKEEIIEIINNSKRGDAEEARRPG